MRARSVLLALLASAIAFVGSAGIAHALPTHPANGCNSNDFGLICIDTSGGGTFVGSVSSSLAAKIPVPTAICNKEFKVHGTLADGQVFERRAVAGCGYFRVSTVFQVNRNLKSGTALCTAVKEIGPSPFNPGDACVMVQA
jgi:hypothetical protein